MDRPPVLLVLTDRAPLRRTVLQWSLPDVEPAFFEDAAEALAAARKLPIDVAIVDARDGMVDGLPRKLRGLPSAPELLILPPEEGSAIDAPAANVAEVGASPETLRRHVDRLLGLQRVRRDSGLVGSGPAMQELTATIAQVAPLDVPVLLEGESGTGKELVARALHRGSQRAERPFVSVNVGSLAESLLESELFGHEKGAFTGAVARRPGVFERANGGTLFLDEVGEMPPAMQVKLLRVLESSEYQRVGGAETLRTDVRLLTATHRSLETEMASGRFRADLYFRLKVVKVHIPPLRERLEDIPALVHHFLEEANRRHDLRRRGLTREAMERLVRYAWPGNVRELRNVVSSMAVLGKEDLLGVGDLPPDLGSVRGSERGLPVPAHPHAHGEDPILANTLLTLMAEVREISQRLSRIEAQLDGEGPRQPWRVDASDAEYTPIQPDLGPDLESAEKAMIDAALRQNDGNRRKASEQLGISERTLYRKLKAYGLG